MTEEQTISTGKDEAHSKIMELIPWYANGTLSGVEKTELDDHLLVCKECRTELSRCQQVADDLPPIQENWQPSAQHFASILANVDRLETASTQPNKRQGRQRPTIFSRLSGWLSQTPNPIRWTLALESLACAALIVFVVSPYQSVPGKVGAFETLSDVEAVSTERGYLIRLLFSDDMTARELLELLTQTKAQIRQGPSELGNFTVEVEQAEAARLLSIFRAHSKVRLAQPVDDGQS